MTDEGEPLSVDELVEYCRTQAGLLSGRVETMGAETDDLLAEIDEELAELRARLSDHGGGAREPSAAPSTAEPADAGDEIADLEAIEADLEEKQAVAEAKRVRMTAVQGLAAAYTELAEELDATVDDGGAALDRVVRFERDRDAPASFDDRRTVLEAAAASDGSPGE
jgi:hypothetical protein